MQYHETANGPAYTHTSGAQSVTIVFPYSPDTAAWLLWNGRFCTIDNPSRFGSTHTPAARRAFVASFVNATQTAV